MQIATAATNHNTRYPLIFGSWATMHRLSGGRFTPETLQRAVNTAKDAAQQAGRDPASVRTWSCLATVGDHLPEQLRLKKTVARPATYLQGYGDLLVNTNGWDPAVLQRFRDDKVVQSVEGGIDHKATADQIEHFATLIPDEWLEPAATGSPHQCADRVRKEFGYGADAVIMHSATPMNWNRSSGPTGDPRTSRGDEGAGDPSAAV